MKLEWISGAEGIKFARIASEFTEKIKSIGPLNLTLNKKIDWKELSRVIAAVGSSGKVLWDDKKCMVEVIMSFLDFVQKTSCGQCIPCRVGSKRLKEGLELFLDGERESKVELLIKLLAEDVGYSSKCDLGKLAGKAIKYTLELCYEDFLIHKEGRCGLNVLDLSVWDKVLVS